MYVILIKVYIYYSDNLYIITSYNLLLYNYSPYDIFYPCLGNGLRYV